MKIEAPELELVETTSPCNLQVIRYVVSKSFGR